MNTPLRKVSKNVIDILKPSIFLLWQKYSKHFPWSKSQISIEDFAFDLERIGAIELFHMMDTSTPLKCKILSEDKIINYIRDKKNFCFLADMRRIFYKLKRGFIYE